MKFISKDLAIKLKEKGFDRPCFGWYDIENNDDKLILNVHEGTLSYKNLLEYTNDITMIADAPTIEQVLEWLREEKKIMLWMKPYHTYATKNHICWDWNISIVNNNHELSKYCSDEGFAKYEDACIAGIEYVINNLI